MLKLFAMASLSIKTPLPGMGLQVHVAPGQYVSAAAPLVTVIDLNPIWIRVPVPEIDLPVIDPRASVDVIAKNPNHGRGDKPFNAEAKPLESALNGIPHMTTLRSKSVQGVSQVVLLFERGTAMVKVRQMVSERVALVAKTPSTQARAPVVMPPLSSTSQVLHIGLTPNYHAISLKIRPR